MSKLDYKPTDEHKRILARDPGIRATTPWHQGTANCADGHAICCGPCVVAVVSGGGYPVGEGWSPNSHANAAFVVRAVNAHAALVESLDATLDALERATNGDEYGEYDGQIKQARAALSLAKSQEEG